MSLKPELHQSHINLFVGCGMAYKHRYVDGIRRPPGAAAITGTATHKSVENNLGHKIGTGQLLPVEQVMEIARDAVNQTWDREGALLDEEERAEGEASVRGHVVDMAVKLARLHHEQVAPQIEPVAVERTFKLELPNHSVDLVGTIDVEERDGIRDHKCFARTPSQFDVDRSLQLTMYALAKRTLDGQEPKRISLDVLLKLKRGPRVETFQTTRGPDDYRALLDRVAVVTRAIEQGVFIPTTPDNWRCSPKWCGYYDICQYAGGRRSTQVPLIRPPSAA